MKDEGKDEARLKREGNEDVERVGQELKSRMSPFLIVV
jgi:hypothetical protein